MDRIAQTVKDFQSPRLYKAAAGNEESELFAQELASYFLEYYASGDRCAKERENVLELVGEVDRLIEGLGLALFGDLSLKCCDRLVPDKRDSEEMRNADPSAYELDRFDIVLRKEYHASAEEREPEQQSNQPEYVIERQERQVLDL